MKLIDLWNSIQTDSIVMWKDANRVWHEATVIGFTSPTAYIKIRTTEDQQVYSVYIESLRAIKLDNDRWIFADDA